MFKRIRQTALLAALAAAVALPASAGVPEGVALLNKQDYKAAMKEFEAEAAKDNSEAMYYIGEIFHRGLGMNPQRLTGIHWWEKAAYLGNERAMLALSEVFNKGLGVKAEPRQAYVWDLTAARQGNPLAQYNVGTYWLYGTSVPKDLTEAAKWFRRSALQGNPAALDALARQLNMGDGVERDVFAAYVLFEALRQVRQRLHGRRKREGDPLAHERGRPQVRAVALRRQDPEGTRRTRKARAAVLIL